jgi:ATP-dependent Clp protease ATP-binding subunit ClpA
MFERFTDSARDCVTRAQREALGLSHGYIGTEHLLIALADDAHGVAGHVLRELGATPESLRADIVRIVGRGGPDPDALATIGIDLDQVRARVEEAFGPGALEGGRGGHIPFTPRSKKSLELALREARARGDDFIGSEHLLLGIARVEEGVGARLLAERGCNRERVAAAVDRARRAA